MTHYKMLDRVPSVMITSNKNELKVYQGNEVYLNNGDNFELRLFNPLNEKIGVEIIFNGVKKGDSYLVLNPGQDVTLDRFLDEQRKMVFETYTVDGNNNSAMKAIEQNGLITFNFYKEYYRSNFRIYYNDVNINYNFPPNPFHYNSTSFSQKSKGVRGTNCVNGSIGSPMYNTTNNINYGILSQESFTNITTTSFTSNASYTTSDASFNSSLSLPKTIETGRVEKGDMSNQQLRQVNTEFQNDVFHTISYRMLPYSSKNQNINEIRQYCSHCGYRLRKQSWNYCPKCGSEVC